jgi:hypothetical protein
VPESSVKTTNVGASLLPAMLSGKVDATLGAFWNVEGVELRLRRQRPWIVPVNRLGVPDYDELVLVANSDKLDDQRDDLRLFISAVSRRPRRAFGDATRNLIDNNRTCAAHDPRRRVVPTLPEGATGLRLWTPSSGATTAAGWSTPGVEDLRRGRDAHQRLLPGEGL